MLSSNIDLGQLITAGAIGIIGYLIKRELTSMSSRLDSHDSLILKLVHDVGTLIGNRRKRSINSGD